MNVTTILASDWYQNLMQLIPDGKLFSLRSVFDGIPRIVQQLPTTILLTIGGALFGLVLALLFAIVKINRVKVLYPLQAFFVSFLKGTPILVQLMLTYYGIPLALKASISNGGLVSISMLFQLLLLRLSPLLSMKQLMAVKPFVQPFSQSILVRLKRHAVWG